MLALIPARGGSKGLPGKNLRPLAGKPLIVHTIESALAAKSIDRVVVSTESPEIAAVARDAGADVPFMRPAALASDDSLVIDTYTYTVDRLRAEGMEIDTLTALLPTVPFRTADDIAAAIRVFRDRDADSVVSYYRAPHPIAWYRYIDENGVLRSFVPEGDRLANRQAEREAYLPNGAIYVFRYRILKELGVYYTDRSYPYIMPRNRSVDIDSLEDFRFAEFLVREGLV